MAADLSAWQNNEKPNVPHGGVTGPGSTTPPKPILTMTHRNCITDDIISGRMPHPSFDRGIKFTSTVRVQSTLSFLAGSARVIRRCRVQVAPLCDWEDHRSRLSIAGENVDAKNYAPCPPAAGFGNAPAAEIKPAAAAAAAAATAAAATAAAGAASLQAQQQQLVGLQLEHFKQQIAGSPPRGNGSPPQVANGSPPAVSALEKFLTECERIKKLRDVLGEEDMNELLLEAKAAYEAAKAV